MKGVCQKRTHRAVSTTDRKWDNTLTSCHRLDLPRSKVRKAPNSKISILTATQAALCNSDSKRHPTTPSPPANTNPRRCRPSNPWSVTRACVVPSNKSKGWTGIPGGRAPCPETPGTPPPSFTRSRISLSSQHACIRTHRLCRLTGWRRCRQERIRSQNINESTVKGWS